MTLIEQSLAVPEDLSALAWVADELRRTLETAHKALRRQLRELETAPAGVEVDGAASVALQQARAQFHQGAGALDMVGETQAARMVRASEMAVIRLSGRVRELDAATVQSIERASFAVLDFLRRRLAGKEVSSLAMFPQYRAVQTLAGADRIHPADLWSGESGAEGSALAERLQALGRAAAAWPAAPLQADAQTRGRMEQGVLAMLRGPAGPAAAQMSALFAGLAAGASGKVAGAWAVAAAFFEAQARGGLQSDVYSKRLTSRLLAQVRLAERGDTDVPDRLAQDLLFFCARAAGADDAPAPMLAAVRRVFALAEPDAADYEQEALGRYDPALIPLARRRVETLKESWSAATAGQPGSASSLRDQAAQVADSVRKLHAEGDHLARALDDAAAQVAEGSGAPAPGLAMEVATSLLCLDAALADADIADAAFGHHIRQLAERIDLAREGRRPGPIEPWMEDLYRRASDRQTMGSVVQELRASLADIEGQLDKFNRNPSERELLIPVPAKLSAMRGVLSVLGLDQAGQAVVRMRDDVDEVLVRSHGAEPSDPRQRAAAHAESMQGIGRLAGNVGALGFLIDLLGVQPQLAKALFRFDPVSGRLEAVMGRAEAAPEPLAAAEAEAEAAPGADASTVAQATPEAVDSTATESERPAETEPAAVSNDGIATGTPATLADTEAHLGLPIELEPAAEGEIAAVVDDDWSATIELPAPLAAAAPGQDDEMREVFFEEAAEVVAEARQGLARLAGDTGHFESIATLRRAFHTLKGSARMVGLREFGEAAWACEQLYNACLAEPVIEADPALRTFSGRALDELERWVGALVAGDASTFRADALVAQAQALRDAAAQAAPVAVPPATDVDHFDLDEFMLEDDLPSDTERMADGFAPTALMPEGFAPTWPADLPDLDSPPAAMADSDWLHVDLDLPSVGADADGAAPGAPAEEKEEAGLDFMLDLGALDDAPAVPAPEADAPSESPPTPEPVAAPKLEPEPELATPAGVVSASDTFDATRAAANEDEDRLPADDAENYKIIGPLRIGLGLFNIFLNEADEQSRRLCTALAEWALELPRPVGEDAVAPAHSLAGNCATVGHVELSALARRLEHALEASRAREVPADEAAFYVEVAEEIRRLLHQFAAGFLRPPPPALLARFDALQAPFTDAAVPAARLGAVRFSVLDEPAPAPAVARAEIAVSDVETPEIARDLDAQDAIDPELFEIFSEEAQELLPALAAHLRAWEETPSSTAEVAGALRALHTLKGSARLAGAMRLGELSHRLESAFEERAGGRSAAPPSMATLHAGVDALSEEFQRLLRGVDVPAPGVPSPDGRDAGPAMEEGAPPGTDAEAPAQARVETASAAPGEAVVPAAEAARPRPGFALPDDATSPAADVPASTSGVRTLPRPAPANAEAGAPAIDWSRFTAGPVARGPIAAASLPMANPATASVRVRAPLLDRLVNQAGEVSITRSRLETGVAQMRASLRDLTDNLDRLRAQLRDIELQADMHIASRLEASKTSAVDFDPLEMDRFTRFQEVTRMMAESVNDVATVQRSFQQSVQSAEDEMAAQARLTRGLQEDLLRARMVPFDALSERLYRVVRQAAKETSVQVRLNVDGSAIELDRSVLDRIAGAFEHLLRNAVVHGIEPPETRRAQGKDPVGSIDVTLTQQGNEVRIEIRDDGRGLDLKRIEARAREKGLLAEDARPSDADLANLIFASGFTTTEDVTELAGRGVGMDVVRTDVTALGGRIETASAPGRGTAFRLLLPLTTAVTRVVQLRCGELSVAVPASLVETVRRAAPEDLDRAYASGAWADEEADLPFFWLGALLHSGAQAAAPARTGSVVLLRSAEQRIALHVDQVLGNQEVVVKNLGPQLARLPGLAGMSLLATGEIVPIYNPVALAAVYGSGPAAGQSRTPAAAAEATPPAPLVLVVDDSLTVRRVTQRLLVREGFRVAVARDGLDALAQLEAETPAVMLADIEMPRMDGFDLLRNVRGNERWRALPVIMITSRIAQKHRDLALQLGADHYLGKPYDEEQLVALVRRHVPRHASA